MDTTLAFISDFLDLLGRPIFQLSGTKVSMMSLSISLIIFVASIKIGRYLGGFLNKALNARSVDSGVRDSIEKFVRYFIIGIGILLALDNMGVSVNSLASIGAILMVGIGFGLQNITQNFVSGIIILIERPIKVGDIIQVGSISGRILDIRVRSTVIQTRDEVSIILPNSKLISEEVINDSYSGQRVRQHITVGVAYGTDIQQVKDLLIKAALSHEKVLTDPEPIAIFLDFGESSLDFDLRFWCEDLWYVDQVLSDVRCEIDSLFRQAEVEIPFPQRVVYTRK
jgi:small-conductance mechanosensitive channel